MGEASKPNAPKPPIPPEPDYAAAPTIADRGPEVVATTLAPQLGSSTRFLSSGDVDMRKLSIINEKDIPLLIYIKLRSKKSRAWATVYDEFLNLQVSVNGRGRRDIIRMEGVSKGGLPEPSYEAEKPGWFERNITDRRWKKNAQDEMI